MTDITKADAPQLLILLAQQLQQTGDILARLSDMLRAPAPAQAPAQTPAQTPEAPRVTLDMLRSLLTHVCAESEDNREAVAKLIADHGAEKLSALRPEEYTAVYAKAVALNDGVPF